VYVAPVLGVSKSNLVEITPLLVEITPFGGYYAFLRYILHFRVPVGRIHTQNCCPWSKR